MVARCEHPTKDSSGNSFGHIIGNDQVKEKIHPCKKNPGHLAAILKFKLAAILKKWNGPYSKWYIASHVFRSEKHDYNFISMIQGHFDPLIEFWNKLSWKNTLFLSLASWDRHIFCSLRFFFRLISN